MPRILFVTTVYRVGERIYPIIPKLSEKYKLDLVKLYQMDPSYEWPGDNDLRNNFDKKYLKYFDKVYKYENINSAQILHFSEPVDTNIDYSKYNLIITDDNRTFNGLGDIYRQRKCLQLACSHGVSEAGYETNNIGKSYDGCFVFGRKEVKFNFQIPAGIPANDMLSKYLNIEKKHILVIINYLGHEGQVATGTGRNFKLFDKEVFDKLDLLSLQQQNGYPVVIKLKSRTGVNIEKDTTYINSILPKALNYNIIYDVEDDNKLIAESIHVFSAPSTLALKPIQLGIPTTLIPWTGQTGIFYDYETNKNFIEDTVEGGKEFNSTQCFLNYIEMCI